MKGRAIIYEPEELAWIEANKTLPRAEAHALFCARFLRSDVRLVNFNSLCKRKGWMTGRTGCFSKGQVPPNKGKKGWCAPGSEKGTSARAPGRTHGVAPDMSGSTARTAMSS